MVVWCEHLGNLRNSIAMDLGNTGDIRYAGKKKPKLSFRELFPI
jgi:hypothetical protein